MHTGLFDLAVTAPDIWTLEEVYEPNRALRMDDNFLSEDFCVISGEYFFVRCVVLLPVLETEETFGFGVWSSLSKSNFIRYTEGFDSGSFADVEPWFGWFSNRLKYYPDTLNLPCEVHPMPGRKRPHLVVTDDNHPIAAHIRDGISPQVLLEIYAANGHEPDTSGPESLKPGWMKLFSRRK